MSLPLKDDARAALERYLADDLALEETPGAYRAVRETFASIGVYSAGVDFARWLLAADTEARCGRAAGAAFVPHVVLAYVAEMIVRDQELARASAMSLVPDMVDALTRAADDATTWLAAVTASAPTEATHAQD